MNFFFASSSGSTLGEVGVSSGGGEVGVGFAVSGGGVAWSSRKSSVLGGGVFSGALATLGLAPAELDLAFPVFLVGGRPGLRVGGEKQIPYLLT